jgi:hypothetical protein
MEYILDGTNSNIDSLVGKTNIYSIDGGSLLNLANYQRGHFINTVHIGRPSYATTITTVASA